MPKFYGQNKKKINPRYFLEETVDEMMIHEDINTIKNMNKVFDKVYKAASNKKVKDGVSLVKDLVQKETINIGDVSKFFFNLDPIKGLKVNLGKFKEVGRNPAVLVVKGLLNPEKAREYWGVTIGGEF